LSLLFPELAGFVQPLGGEYAGRRDVLEAVPFVEGWGVEIGLLVDVVARVGLGATAQVDLGVREHRNRPLDELGAQATSILVTALRRAGLTDVDHTTLTRFTEAFEPERIAIDASERPPLLTIPEYCRKFAHRTPCRATG
jgi:glucosyl-3-phosphoglycerate synthase